MKKTTDKMLCERHDQNAELVSAARARIPEAETRVKLTDFFKVLGDGTRLSILLAIEESPMCVCDISAALGMTKSAVSHQLKILRSASLVASRRDGKRVIYSPADDHVRDVVDKALEHVNE